MSHSPDQHRPRSVFATPTGDLLRVLSVIAIVAGATMVWTGVKTQTVYVLGQTFDRTVITPTAWAGGAIGVLGVLVLIALALLNANRQH